ncbi:MAG: rhodanese-like domain-containing protein, partial [Paracoccaceae bacterium]|nr:rhodanese-like domain-containing protein [Paracoccaceae bacterium]
MTKLKITAAQMVANARARIKEIETNDLIKMIEDPEVVIVDIRDIRERQRGHIPGSVH